MTPQFLLEKLAQQLALIDTHRVRKRHLLPELEFAETDSFHKQVWHQLDWQPLAYNQYWGEWSQSFAIRTRYQIPLEWDTEATIALSLPLGNAGDAFEAHPEALIYIDEQAFTAVDARHNEITLPPQHKNHAEHTLHLHGWTGLGDSLFGDYQPKMYVRPCEIWHIDDVVQQFVVLARNAMATAAHLPESDTTRHRLLRLLRQSFAKIDTRHPIGERFYQSLSALLPQFRADIQSLGTASNITIHAVGHAHIDTAWLWTLDITRGKAVRTFHTALHLMERYPDYHFVQSQPQLYAYATEQFPALFRRIQEKAQAGQWEPLGGMWVEADCNVPNGESLARQFLHGQRYFKRHFGAISEILWLPDTFGFPHSLPQIAKQAGIKYFFTTKLRWSETNEIPHDTFIWRGLDGSDLIAHFTPTPMQFWLRMPTYNADLNAQSAIETWERMHDKQTMTRAIMAYGWGDGGGGPTPEMLDNLGVLADFPAVPQLKPTSARAFFQHIEREQGATLPVWDGALYLETHQGTFTSQAWIKKANRDAEKLLHDVECMATWAMLVDETYEYPQDTINAIWERVLLNQFHDILPGSSIKAVYDDARDQYKAIMRELNTLRDNALDALKAHFGGDVLLVNTTSFERQDVALWQGGTLAEGQGLFMPEGTEVVAQQVDEGVLMSLFYTPLAPLSITPLTLKAIDPDAQRHEDKDMRRPIHIDAYAMDNKSMAISLDTNGDLISLLNHIADREVIQGIANQFQIFEDRPLRFNAWNIDPDYEDKMWLAEPADSIEIVEQNDMRVTLKIVRRIMNSTITQHISMFRESYRIDFHTHVDWQERNMLLKVAFPLAFKAQNIITGTQWGEIRIPHHRNTSWEVASYERPFQQYIRVSEGRQGLALLADSKYGFDFKDNTLRLTLLKGATYPDPTADLGKHEFTYSLVPFGNTDATTIDIEDDTLYHSATFQYPVISSPTSSDTMREGYSFVHVPADTPNIVIETIKKAEDSHDVVVRLRETQGKLTLSVLETTFTVKQAWLSNILEAHLNKCTPSENSVTLQIKPYQVLTLIIEFARVTS
jgi:alpha-mannosidase